MFYIWYMYIYIYKNIHTYTGEIMVIITYLKSGGGSGIFLES